MPLSSKRLGLYEILGPLGVGGMGEVYRARDSRLGREVAIKILPEAVSDSPNRLARFEREARSVAALNHPNIITLHSVEEVEGIRFLTMELVEGDTLDRHIVAGGLPLPRVLDLSIPVAQALVAAHERGVIHRDLKPNNVMVTHDGWVKVLDFGLAKIAESKEDDPGATIAVTGAPLSGEGQVLGTVPYMAPEQIRGKPVDARSDLFAMGILLYELATGRRPFTGETPADVGSAILREVPPTVLSIRGDLPRDLSRIVERCLEKDPRDRFQTARGVLNELRYVQREAGASMHAASATPTPSATPSPTPVPPGPQSPVPRTPSPMPPSPRDLASIAVLPFVNRSRSEEDEYFSDGLADELLNVLTKIRGLRVAARASSFQFKGKNEDLATIGEKLNVATLLDGSVRKAGNRVRISVQLVKAADRVQLWSETYDRSLDDIFAVQDDIAQSVVMELRTTLLGAAPDSDESGKARAEVAEAAEGHGQDAEAHRLYLQGKYFLERLNEEDAKKAAEYLNDAVKLEPSNAYAWVELSRANSIMAAYNWVPVAVGYQRAREAATRALELKPDMAEAHARLASVQRAYYWEWKEAEKSIRRALELAPGNTDTLRAAAVLAHQRGRLEEAERLFRTATEQDPLNAGAYSALALLYRSMDRLHDAEKMFRKSLELTPQRVGTHHILGIVLASQGRDAEALAEVNRDPADWSRLTGLAYVHFKAGRIRESDDALRKLEEGYADTASYQVALIYAARGEIDTAFRWLERAFDDKDAGLSQSMAEPMLRSLHGDPRWREFLRKMGLMD